ncbi:MAG: hypothetical protein ACLR6B_05790 [Blautia sp.]
MKKKFLMALFFAGLLVCVPAENTVPARADTVTEKAKVKDGWVTEGNARYYYTDGKKATGFTKISGKTYFLIPRPERSRQASWSIEEKSITSVRRPERRYLAGPGSMENLLLW